MIEVRWHGRGGQGGFTASRLLGKAAALFEDKYAMAFPSFGPERRGAPVLAFTRIDGKKITNRSEVINCDYVVVLDETLAEESAVNGLKPDGALIINTADPVTYRKRFPGIKIVTLDATNLALEIMGRPITNTAMFGALVAESDVVSLESALKGVEAEMKKSLVDKNQKIVEKAYMIVKGGSDV